VKETRSAIVGLWEQLSVDEIGPQALARLLIVYPWTQRYFASLGDLSSPAAIMGNPKVATHGKVVMGALEKGVKNLDDIKSTYAALSEMHSDKFHVDPDNFKVGVGSFGLFLTICVAMKLGPSVFTADAQDAWSKFLAVVVSAFCEQSR
uniref:Globin domain-containing protein n=1 Tax=Electrophorus electricus TaxID=8005 RepID=A0A4W4DUR7_ELEEL